MEKAWNDMVSPIMEMAPESDDDDGAEATSPNEQAGGGGPSEAK